MRLGVLGISLAGLAAVGPPAESGLKVIARETLPALIVETSIYAESARSRHETRVQYTGADPLGQPRQEQRNASITRCDLNRIIALNYGDRTYETYTLRSRSGVVENLLASLASVRPRARKHPSLLVEITTVDTGERKTVFGYRARRVIVIRRDIPLDPAGGAKSEARSDGWYIDLEGRPGCGAFATTGVRAVLTTAGGPSSIPSVTFRDLGTPEYGYPIDIKTTTRFTDDTVDGVLRENTYATRKVVTELSREPLDPALFEIPAGFREADRLQPTFAARWRLGMHRVKELLAALFR